MALNIMRLVYNYLDSIMILFLVSVSDNLSSTIHKLPF